MPSPINLPTVPANDDQLPARVPLVPERSDFLEDDAPTANKVEAFLAQALAATGTDAPTTAGALVPWICDALLSNHSVKAYGRDLLEAIPADTLQGIRDLALMSVFFLTGCRVSAVVGACVGHLETDAVEHYLHVPERRNQKRREILLEAARPALAYMTRAGNGDDQAGPLLRPREPDASGGG